MKHPETGEEAGIRLTTFNNLEYVDGANRVTIDRKDVRPLFGTSDMFRVDSKDFHASRFNREFLSRKNGIVQKGYHV